MRLPEFLRKGGIKPGPPEDFPRGSVDRAKALTVGIVSSWNLAATTERAWQSEVDRARTEEVHRLLGFEEFDVYLKATIGETADSATEKVKARAAVAEPTASTGRPKKGTKVVPLSKGGNDRLAARIKKKRPDIHERMKAGEFKSVRAAAIEAGIVKVPTPAEKARKAFLKLSAKDRCAFLRWASSEPEE